MPLGGLLPYDNDPLAAIRSQLGMSVAGPEAVRGATDSRALPSPAPAQGFDIAALIPQLLAAFSAGQAIRQRNPSALMDVVSQFASMQDQRARGKRADEAQRLREEREHRLAEMASTREDRLASGALAQEERLAASAKRQGQNDLQGLVNQIEDNARQVFTSARPEGPALESYVQSQAERVQPMGGDPMKVKDMLLSLVTMIANQQPEQVDYIERQPGTPPPAKIAKGAVVRNAPQPRQPREAPLPRAYNTTDEEGNVFRVVEDPRTGKEISRTKTGKRPKPAGREDDALDKIIKESQGKGGSTSTITVKAPNGTTYTFKSQAEADAFKRAAGIR